MKNGSTFSLSVKPCEAAIKVGIVSVISIVALLILVP